MTINKHKSVVEVAGVLGCKEDADGWTMQSTLTSWIPVAETKPRILHSETYLRSPQAFCSPFCQVPLCLQVRQNYDPLGDPGQVSACPLGANSRKISWTCSQLPPAWRSVTFPNLIIWRNIINVFLWPSFRKVWVRASTLLICICCSQRNRKTISSSFGLLKLSLNTPIPRGLHGGRKCPMLVRSPAVYYFFPSWLPRLQKVLILFKIQSSFIDISSFAKQLNWSRRH